MAENPLATIVINREKLVRLHNALNSTAPQMAIEVLELVEEALDIIDRRHRIIPVVQFRGAIQADDSGHYETGVLFWTLYYMVLYRFITRETIAAAKAIDVPDCNRIGIMTGYNVNSTLFYYTESAEMRPMFVASTEPIEKQEHDHNQVLSLFTNIDEDVIYYETIRVLAENGYFSAKVLHEESKETFESIGILPGQAIEIKVHFPKIE